MNDPIVYVDGQRVAADQPALSVLDEGFTLGLSVFDTLLLEDGCLYFLEEHFARLREGCVALGLGADFPFDLPATLDRLTEDVGEHSAAVRVTVTRGVPGRGPTRVVQTRPIPVRPVEGLTLDVSGRAKLGGAAIERVKSTNRMRNILALEEARAHGADEALLPTEEGDFSEGTFTNLFVARDGVVVTPGPDRGALRGIMRGVVLELLRPGLVDGEGVRWTAREGRVERGDLEEAGEVFLTSTLGRVMAVRRVVGVERAYPGGAGALATSLRERVRAVEDAYRERAGRSRAQDA